MEVKSIRLFNFRNYADENFEFKPGVNIICGNNAQGKTNLLEAIFVLSSAKSFRTSGKTELIGFEKEMCRIEGILTSRKRLFNVSVSYRHKTPTQVWINGIKTKTNQELAGLLNVVLFSPDDLTLVKSGASERRRFLNTALCQLRPQYASALADYNRFLENKQRILRDGWEKPSYYDALDDFSAGMAWSGAQLIRRRAEFTRLVNEEGGKIHSEISGETEKLSVFYKTSSAVDDPLTSLPEIENALFSCMIREKKREIDSRQCLYGPHRDDLEMTINEKPVRLFGSQGQTRTAALSMKMAEREIFLKDTGEYPVLLLDDVLSELDASRQDYVINRIAEGQVLITCCDEEKLAGSLNGHVTMIENGKLIQG